MHAAVQSQMNQHQENFAQHWKIHYWFALHCLTGLHTLETPMVGPVAPTTLYYIAHM